MFNKIVTLNIKSQLANNQMAKALLFLILIITALGDLAMPKLK